MGFFNKLFGSHSDRELKRIQPLVEQILQMEERYAAMDEEELKAQTGRLKERLAKGETVDEILPAAFTTMREAAWRVLGLKHYPVQLVGGIVLHQGRIAEMKTGEGKTLGCYAAGLFKCPDRRGGACGYRKRLSRPARQ